MQGLLLVAFLSFAEKSSCSFAVMNFSTVGWGLFTLKHTVISDKPSNSQAIVSEYAVASTRLCKTMRLKSSPLLYCLFVTPKRQRQNLSFVGQACEAFNRDETFDFFEIRPKTRRNVQILLLVARSRDDFKDNRDHLQEKPTVGAMSDRYVHAIAQLAGARGSRTHRPDRRAGTNGVEVRETHQGPSAPMMRVIGNYNTMRAPFRDALICFMQLLYYGKLGKASSDVARTH